MIDNSCYFKQAPSVQAPLASNNTVAVNNTKENLKYDTFEGRTKGSSKTWLKNSIEPYAGYKKLKDKFTDEEIKQFNEKKELPKGYYLKAVPKYLNISKGVKVEDGKMPKALILVKLSDKKAGKIKSEGKFLSNKMPEGYKLENGTNGKTYLLSEKHKDFQSTRKWLKRDTLENIGIFVAAMATVFGGCAYLLRNTK